MKIALSAAAAAALTAALTVTGCSSGHAAAPFAASSTPSSTTVVVTPLAKCTAMWSWYRQTGRAGLDQVVADDQAARWTALAADATQLRANAPPYVRADWNAMMIDMTDLAQAAQQGDISGATANEWSLNRTLRHFGKDMKALGTC